MPQLRPLLPALLAVAVLGTLAGGVVAAGDLRDDERRERAAAAARRAAEAERRATEAYRAAVTPVALAVYDVVQPLQQAYADLDDGDVSAIDVLVDVGVHVAGDDGLKAVRPRLEAITPPARLADEHDQLLAALDELAEAAAVLAPLRRSSDESRFADVVADGDLALDEATLSWIRPVTPVYEGAETPAVPGESGLETGRVPRSHASYLRLAGNLCSAGIDESLDAAEGREATPEQITRSLARLDDRVPLLLAVPAAGSDEARVRTAIRTPLQRSDQLGKGFRAVVAAARAGDLAGVRAGQAQVLRGETALEKAAAGYRAYGSETCSLYLVGLEDETGDGGDQPRAT